ncbi:MAG: MarR family winged helix-turn-helix transcriptional regulator [Clostridia bacterium]|nr:MarR family winged helix-turn-helix transcriptional regulator [Clostridia bacterium]
MKQNLFAKLCYLHRQMKRSNEKLFEEYSLTPIQFHALSIIRNAQERGERARQKDVENGTNLRPSAVSSMLTTLEKRGYVVRKQDETDARLKYLELTEMGVQASEDDKSHLDECDEVIQSALSEEEQEEFDTLLNKIIVQINGQEDLW